MKSGLEKIFLFGVVPILILSCFSQDEPKYVELMSCTTFDSFNKDSIPSKILNIENAVSTTQKNHLAYVCYDTNSSTRAFVSSSGKANLKVVINRETIIDGNLNEGLYNIDLSYYIKDKNSLSIYYADSLVLDLFFLGKK
jgi:hypothetical protein